jgi:hypothetical protein
MKAKNQITIAFGLFAILAIATIAANSQQTTEAKSTGDNNFGQTASGQAHDSQNDQTGGNGLDANSNDHRTDFGKDVSGCAKGPDHCH